jgi:Family of unknown function (DUF5681)
MRRKGKGTRKPSTGYAVGYGRPPIWSRFQSGQSGNPKGRPRGARSAAAMAQSALERKIPVTESGAKRSMTVREVAYRRIAEKAISGDIKALICLLSLEDQTHQPESDLPEAAPSSDQDLEIIQAFLKRWRAAKEH